MIIEELYEALIEAGASKEKASAAARAVTVALVTREHLDLRISEVNARIADLESRLTLRLAELESRITIRVTGLMIAQTAIIAALVKLL